MATSSSRAYYVIVTRLKAAGLDFRSVVPDRPRAECDLIITTSSESLRFGDKAVGLEDLSENPGVFKGQILSRLSGGEEVLVIGVDPGVRTGMAAFYGEVGLAFDVLWSVGDLRSRIAEFVRSVPAGKAVIRIGTGNLELALKIARALSDEIPKTLVEMVNEAGTSGGSKTKGLQGDQEAAAKIAFRKGAAFTPASPRNQP